MKWQVGHLPLSLPWRGPKQHIWSLFLLSSSMGVVEEVFQFLHASCWTVLLSYGRLFHIRYFTAPLGHVHICKKSTKLVGFKHPLSYVHHPLLEVSHTPSPSVKILLSVWKKCVGHVIWVYDTSVPRPEEGLHFFHCYQWQLWWGMIHIEFPFCISVQKLSYTKKVSLKEVRWIIRTSYIKK